MRAVVEGERPTGGGTLLTTPDAVIDEGQVDQRDRTSGAVVDPIAVVVQMLQQADRHIVAAVAAIRHARQTGAAIAGYGMPLERLVALLAERTRTDVGVLCRVEVRLSHMPHLDAAFTDGHLSWSQVRGVICATDPLNVEQAGMLDRRLVSQVGRGEPDRIVQVAFGIADSILIQTAADPVVRPDPGGRRRLHMQPDLFGSASLHLHDTIDAVATVWEAANAAADPPQAQPDDADCADRTLPFGHTPRRAQLAEGLRRVAAAHLAGRAGHTHGGSGPSGCSSGAARPSVSVVIDHTDLTGAAGHALVRWHAGPVRLTATTTERLLCDAALDTVIVDDRRPIAVGDSHAPITNRHRRTLTAVDRGCRMPGCAAPAQHCDAHHVIPRMRGGPTSLDNLILLCRPCHVRLHHHRLDLTLDRHSRAVTLTLPKRRHDDGHTFTSLPN